MPGPRTETALEEAIEEHLLSSGGYEKGDREAFDQKTWGQVLHSNIPH